MINAIRSKVMTIDKDAANKLLSVMAANRPVSIAWVDNLTAAILRGEWKLNGESIKIDRAGNVIDGQHRLRAVVSAARSMPSVRVQMLVTEGLESGVFDTIDGGKKRQASDILAMAGEKNSRSLAACLRTIMTLQRGVVAQYYTTPQIEAALVEHPSARRWVTAYISTSARRFCPLSMAGVLTLGAEMHGDDVALVALEKLAKGANLSPNEPMLMLRERLLQQATKSTRLRQDVALALMVKAWNAHVAGKKIGTLKFGNEESFPIMQ